MINEEGSIASEKGRIFIVDSKIKHHFSYFLIEEKKSGENWVLHYVDAGRFCNKDHYYEDHAATRFEIDESKFDKLEDLKLALKKITDIPFTADRSCWLVAAGIRKYDVRSLSTYLPTQQQCRGNCSFKSLTLLLRVIDEVMYNKTVELLDGELSGEGYERHKEFKYSIIEYCVELVAEMANPKNSDKSFYKEAASFLDEVVLPNAQRKIKKGSEPRAQKLAEYVIETSQQECQVRVGAAIDEKEIPGGGVEKPTCLHAVDSASTFVLMA